MKRAFKILLRARSSVKSPEFQLNLGLPPLLPTIFVSAGCRPRGAENRVSETFAGYGARARTGDSSGAEPLGT